MYVWMCQCWGISLELGWEKNFTRVWIGGGGARLGRGREGDGRGGRRTVEGYVDALDSGEVAYGLWEGSEAHVYECQLSFAF